METIHGGDIYRNKVELDFSVNMNPLGIPKAVLDALVHAVERVGTYPDIHVQALKNKMAQQLSVSRDALLFGNGASELFVAIVHALQPKKVVIPVPSFYGYFHAAQVVQAELVYCEQSVERMKEALVDDVEVLFLANPNNPTGSAWKKEELKELLEHCRKQEIYVVLDECFIEFCEENLSMTECYQEMEHLIIVRAFTKIFTIPGVRLGYLVCGNQELVKKIQSQLPEWNVSVFAQEAGIACLKEQEFVQRTAAFVAKEREFLKQGLQKLGIRTYPSATNFLLFYSERPLYERLLERGILIRDCANFQGLRKGYFRIAVKRREENEMLLHALGEIFWNEEK